MRGPPRPRARPREGPLKRSMVDVGGEWLASQGVVQENSPPLRLAAGLSGQEVQPALSGEGRRRRSGRAAVALGRRIRRSAAGARVGRARGVGAALGPQVGPMG